MSRMGRLVVHLQERCPELRNKYRDYPGTCDLTRNKTCIMETSSDTDCPYYLEFLKEIEEECKDERPKED